MIDGSEWPKACKVGAGVVQGDWGLTSQCRQEYEGVLVGRLKAWKVMQEQDRLLVCWSS